MSLSDDFGNDGESSLHLHGNCLALNGKGLLLIGKPAVGKSVLTAKLCENGAELVADDRVICMRHQDSIMAMPPPRLAGLLAIRGLGRFCLPFRAKVALSLTVELVKNCEHSILPDVAEFDILGCGLPCHRLDADDPYIATRISLLVNQVLLP